jgi:hypothetical protein
LIAHLHEAEPLAQFARVLIAARFECRPQVRPLLIGEFVLPARVGQV